MWAPAGPERYRLYDQGIANPTLTGSGLAALPTPAESYADEGKPWHPDSPLFAFGLLGLLTFGLMAFSTSGSASVRLGKATATIGAGAGIGKS